MIGIGWTSSATRTHDGRISSTVGGVVTILGMGIRVICAVRPVWTPPFRRWRRCGTLLSLIQDHHRHRQLHLLHRRHRYHPRRRRRRHHQIRRLPAVEWRSDAFPPNWQMSDITSPTTSASLSRTATTHGSTTPTIGSAREQVIDAWRRRLAATAVGVGIPRRPTMSLLPHRRQIPRPESAIRIIPIT